MDSPPCARCQIGIADAPPRLVKLRLLTFDSPVPVMLRTNGYSPLTPEEEACDEALCRMRVAKRTGAVDFKSQRIETLKRLP
jgi:hypothetical protein